MAGVDRWLVVGSRRWARILASELCAMLPEGTSIQLQASSGDAGLLEWWSGSPHRKRIEIVEQPIPCVGMSTGVALIVNAAYDHRASIESVLAAGYHAVSEKPLTFSKPDTLKLQTRADELGLKLFCTNTYLFADYLRVFRENWLQGRKFHDVQITWSDAGTETRHGHAKCYDSGVPLIIDILPHVASIILATHGEVRLDHSELAVHKGGSAVTASFYSGELTVHAELARNETQRVRLAKFVSPGERVSLNFSSEPGVVNLNCNEGVCVDPAWASKRKPIAEMLNSVKAYFDGGDLDDRLGLRAALLANDLIDGVVEAYVQQQIELLRAEGDAKELPRDEHFRYALKEADSIRERVIPHLAQASPLRRLALLPIARRSAGLDFSQSGRATS